MSDEQKQAIISKQRKCAGWISFIGLVIVFFISIKIGGLILGYGIVGLLMPENMAWIVGSVPKEQPTNPEIKQATTENESKPKIVTDLHEFKK